MKNLTPKNYYPTQDANPVHEVRNWAYARKIARAALRGDMIPSIVVDGPVGNCNAINGTHRLAARHILRAIGENVNLIPIISIDDLDDAKREAVMELIDENDFLGIDEILDRG